MSQQDWPRFSLRTLLATVALFALAFDYCRALRGEFLRPALGFLGLIIKGAMWSLLIGFGVWLYRSFYLRSLPWLGTYAALAIPLGLATPRVIGAVVNRGSLPLGWSQGDLLATWALGEMVLQSLIGLVITIMVLAEVAGLIARTQTALVPWAFGPLLAAHQRTGVFGVTLIALTLVGPLTACLLWLA